MIRNILTHLIYSLLLPFSLFDLIFSEIYFHEQIYAINNYLRPPFLPFVFDLSFVFD